MPRISTAQLPTVSHSGRVSRYAEQQAELRELLAEANFGAGEAVTFEIDKDDLSPLVSALRKVGKEVDRKVKTIFKDGVLYCQDGGAIPETESE
jgi:hypothetical protein